MSADSLMRAMDQMSQVIEMAAGYRAKCEQAGFSPTIAEHMAVQFHEYVLKTMILNQEANDKE